MPPPIVTTSTFMPGSLPTGDDAEPIARRLYGDCPEYRNQSPGGHCELHGRRHFNDIVEAALRHFLARDVGFWSQETLPPITDVMLRKRTIEPIS